MERLFALQEVDQKLIAARLMPSRAEAARFVEAAQARIADAESVCAALARELADDERRLRTFEFDLQSTETELSEVRSKMFDGSVTQAKELANLQERLESLERAKDRMEEETLVALEAVDQKRSQEARAAKRLQEARSRLDEAEGALGEAERAERALIEQLEEERAGIVQGLPEDLVGRYESLFERLQCRPIARVQGRSCSGCHVTLPTSARRPVDDELGRCPNCGRLLWWTSP